MPFQVRSRISIRGCLSVRPSVGPSVRRLVRNAFVKIAEDGVMQDGDASYVVYTALFLLLLKLFFEMSGNKTVTEIDAWENKENSA